MTQRLAAVSCEPQGRPTNPHKRDKTECALASSPRAHSDRQPLLTSGLTLASPSYHVATSKALLAVHIRAVDPQDILMTLDRAFGLWAACVSFWLYSAGVKRRVTKPKRSFPLKDTGAWWLHQTHALARFPCGLRTESMNYFYP